MKLEQFNCKLCGHCCLNLVDAFRGCVSDTDLQRWRNAGREDLLAWVDTIELGHDNRLHMVWVHPETGEEVDRCPWLLDMLDHKGHLCGIDAVKPDYCRDYPEHQPHAKSTGCPGYLTTKKN